MPGTQQALILVVAITIITTTIIVISPISAKDKC